ncbi:MAG: hypothetical protein RSC10_07260 [Longicatena sp.]
MKQLWLYRFEISIAMNGTILMGSIFFPEYMPKGIYVIMLIMFLLSLVLFKITSIHEHITNKIRHGGLL